MSKPFARFIGLVLIVGLLLGAAVGIRWYSNNSYTGERLWRASDEDRPKILKRMLDLNGGLEGLPKHLRFDDPKARATGYSFMCNNGEVLYFINYVWENEPDSSYLHAYTFVVDAKGRFVFHHENGMPLLLDDLTGDGNPELVTIDHGVDENGIIDDRPLSNSFKVWSVSPPQEPTLLLHVVHEDSKGSRLLRPEIQWSSPPPGILLKGGDVIAEFYWSENEGKFNTKSDSNDPSMEWKVIYPK